MKRGTFHAGLRSQTPFVAVRSTGRRHLTPPTEVTRADSTVPFSFAAPDLEGRLVRSSDARFRGKVVLIDIFGTWCPTCHDAAPLLAELYRDYHARGLEVVGLAFEVAGDSTIDAPQVRRYRDKFGLMFPLLLPRITRRPACETLEIGKDAISSTGFTVATRRQRSQWTGARSRRLKTSKAQDANRNANKTTPSRC